MTLIYLISMMISDIILITVGRYPFDATLSNDITAAEMIYMLI